MSEIRTIPEKILASGIKDASIDTVGKFSKKVIHHNAGAPTSAADTGLGYVVGSIWVDTTNGDMYTATGVTAEDATWINMEGDSVNLFLYQASTTVGKLGGHVDGPYGGPMGYQNTQIESTPVASSGNSTDIGEVSTPLGVKGHQQGCAKDGYPASYIYWYGIQGSHPSDVHVSEMTRHGISATVTVADIGEETNGHASGGQGQSKTHWFTWSGGGYAPSSTGVNNSGPFTTQIEKTTFASPATTADSGGDLSAATGSSLGYTDLSGGKCWMIAGEGQPTNNTEKIESFPTAISAGNQTDEGELSTSLSYAGASCSTTHMYVTGGNPQNDVIRKSSFAAPVADSDIGELTISVYDDFASSGDVAGYRFGGKVSGGAAIDSIDKWSFTTDGNATDVGEMTQVSARGGCWQD